MMSVPVDAHDEVVEVVDEDNLVSHVCSRREVHEKGLLHRAVYFWVFDSSGRDLLQRRSQQCAT
jgi:16S rRNA (adenine1518-N6/adenine1519-N6)-dimethyltransferase